MAGGRLWRMACKRSSVGDRWFFVFSLQKFICRR